MDTIKFHDGAFRFTKASDGSLFVTIQPREKPDVWQGEWPHGGVCADASLTPDQIEQLRDFLG